MRKKISVLILILCVSCTTARKKTTEPVSDTEVISAEPEGKKPIPNIGVILGPGGMRTFAHVAVLREMERARVPISAIAGVEWGALVAGLYSVQGKAHDTEWKMGKLKPSFLPEDGLLGGEAKPLDPYVLNDYLNTVFEKALIENSAVSFACAAENYKNTKSRLFKDRSFKSIMPFCLAFPPTYKLVKGWGAQMLTLEPIIAWMKRQGINYIVYINIEGPRNELIDSSYSARFSDHILWKISRQKLEGELSQVDFVIPIPVKEGFADLDSKRKFYLSGQRAAETAVHRLARELGL